MSQRNGWHGWVGMSSVLLCLAIGLIGCRRGEIADEGGDAARGTPVAGLPEDANQIIQERGLTPDDVAAAVATYTPSGKMDEYIMFASGGHSGQVLVIGLPSMRLLRSIAVFTPEPWQGAGFGVRESPFHTEGDPPIGRKHLTWADTHHPALSETNGDYDGQFLFINDKANARLAVIDLRDFETKQWVVNPVVNNNHGSTMVTPNTDYVVEGSQYAVPLGLKYAPLDKYQEQYRGLMTFWKFDRAKGRIDPAQSFAIELPPYWQDLADSGKIASDGWVFQNSFNTEMATGGIESGNPPFEAGASQRDMDYLHAINYRAAEKVVADGKCAEINGFRVIPLATAVSEGVLYFAAEPKSPHGVDVCPCGKHIVVSGKLDPHVTVYHIDKIKEAVAKKDFEGNDPFGVPILRFDAVKEAQVEIGLGPLHTQFDAQGYAYTSLFLDNAVARWSMGDCKYKAPEGAWKLVGTTPVHYNVGHISAAEGDTVDPDGRFLVALNKWSVDRFVNTGPLLPQNLQLLDTSRPGDRFPVIYDMPLGNAEPHYAQIMKADKLKTWEVYPDVGWDPLSQVKSETAPMKGAIRRNGDAVEVDMIAIRSHFEPEHVQVRQGQKVKWTITNMERTIDATHGFCIPSYNIEASLEPGETVTIEFVAEKEGVFPFYCLEFCSALHLEMVGYLLVEPASN
ncbi:MAG: Sec-dependent nitrous-oxide reductase [Planctomycetes bacterium]|nr:Sec-dependent nitrous-oxide reductase [Planctomycetota bacterium]